MVKGLWENIRKIDWLLILAVFLLLCLGLAAIYSVSLGKGDTEFNLFKKQLTFGIFGFILLLLFALGNYSGLWVYNKIFYWAVLLLLFGVLFFGSIIRGTKGWFVLWGFNFQPVELAKIALVIALAKFFSNRLHLFQLGKHILVSLLLTLFLAVPVLLQPDLGSALVLMGIWGILMLIIGLPKKYLLLFFVLMIVISSLSWFVFFDNYQKDRIITFIRPDLDPLDSGYNVTQSIIAVGSGELWGRGLGFGSQSQLKFIPESQTDFIFAVIAEEMGFFGITLFLCLWLLVFYRLLRIAQRAKNDFGMFLVLGICAIFLIHLLVNVGMNLGIMPVTGISLPFLSSGGSFLLVSLALIGIAESVAVHR